MRNKPWAIIDLETSGVNPLNESIIDVGFLQFSGTQLVEKYSSLVQFPRRHQADTHLSQFIQRLTGISEKALKKAPPWETVEKDLYPLQGHQLIAHNAGFEA